MSIEGSISNWESELREIEEAEQWERSITEIPSIELQTRISNLLMNFSIFQKISIFKLMSQFHWSYKQCDKMSYVFETCLSEKRERIVKLFELYSSHGLLSYAFEFISNLTPPLLNEFAFDISDSEFQYLMEIFRFLSLTDISLIAELCQPLSIRELLTTFNTNQQDLLAKHCRLCRVRKFAALEVRMLHDQYPEDKPKLPGINQIYEKAEIWSGDDEKFFRFDFKSNRVYWKREEVDLVRICDKCLNDVYLAIAASGRNVEIYHSSPSSQLALLTSLKQEDSLRSSLLSSISIQRSRRRLREITFSSLSIQTHGLKIEEKNKIQKQHLQLQKQEQEKKDFSHRLLVTQSLNVDGKWLRIERESNQKDLADKELTAALSYHLGFSRHHPPLKEREHPHSWKLHTISSLTTTPQRQILAPLSPRLAHQRFASSPESREPPPPDNNWRALRSWKNQAQQIQTEIQTLKDADQASQQAERIKATQTYNRILEEDQRNREKKMEREWKEAEENERRRLAQRAADKNMRRAARVAAREAEERDEMHREEGLMRQYLAWEQARWEEELERRGMEAAEKDQCRVDRFWGWEEIERNRLDFERRVRGFYQSRLVDVESLLNRTQRIRPQEKLSAQYPVLLERETFNQEVLKIKIEICRQQGRHYDGYS